MSEKSTRKAPDYAVESTAARNRSVFRPKLRRWSSQTAEERYNSSESGLKKEIPVNAEGITSPERPHRQSIRAWAPSGIREILRNEKYRGKLVWGRTTKIRDPETGKKRMKKLPKEQWTWVDAPELRIVTDEQWNKVQAQIEFVNRHGIARYGGLNRTNASKEYLFSGLLVCGLCGFNIIITAGAGKFAVYGCPGYRSRGICKNSVVIRREVLERQLLAAIAERVLRPDVLEYAIEHVREKFEEDCAVFSSKAKGFAANGPKLQRELRRLQSMAHNLVRAIAEYGHSKSPTMLAELSDVEMKIELIAEDLKQPELPVPQASPQQIRDFVQENIRNLEVILAEDRALARQTLRKHIKRIVLSPKFDPGGNVLSITAGDVDIFSSDNNVLLMVLRERFELSRSARQADIMATRSWDLWCRWRGSNSQYA